MFCKDVIRLVEKQFPLDASMEWDNVGLLVGRRGKDVRKIYVAMDLTDEVIEELISLNVDLVITHHPSIFTPIKRITDDTLLGRKLLTLIQNDICCYAAHTNYDVLCMAELSSVLLELKNTIPLEETTSEKDGIGRVGEIDKSIKLSDLAQMVKSKFNISYVRVFGDLNKMIHRVAISPGSGKSMIDFAIEKGADVLVTGDIDHHTGIDAVDDELCIIDAGHYGLEYIFVKNMANFLKQHLQGIIVVEEPVKHPFVTI